MKELVLILTLFSANTNFSMGGVTIVKVATMSECKKAGEKWLSDVREKGDLFMVRKKSFYTCVEVSKVDKQ